MTREEVKELALSKIDRTKYLILELITGMGKQYQYFTYLVVYIKNYL